MRARCSSVWESTEDGRARVIRCKRFIAPGVSYCEGCAEHYVTEGAAHELRCPVCEEYGDFSHLAADARAAAALDETVTECGSCGARCLILEAVLVVRIELMP